MKLSFNNFMPVSSFHHLRPKKQATCWLYNKPLTYTGRTLNEHG